MLTREQVVELRGLLKQADLGRLAVGWDGQTVYDADKADATDAALIARYDGPLGNDEVCRCEYMPHAELIRAAINALPALLDAAERGLDARARKEQADG